MRAAAGISLPRRPVRVAARRPRARGGGGRSRAGCGSRAGRATMRAPASGCSRTSAHSSSSSGSALSSSSAGSESLPTSWTSAPSWMAGRGVGVGPELQRHVARVEGDGRRVLGGLGVEGRERAHEGDARRERRAVDGAGRAAAAPWGAEESAHSVCSQAGRRRRERVARIAPSVYDAPRVNPCETADGRCEHRPSAFVQRTAGLLPAVGPTMGPTVGPTMGPSVCVHMTLLPVPGTASEVARETILGPSTRRLYRMGTQLCKQSEPAPNTSFRKRYAQPSTDEICPANPGKTNGSRDRPRAAWTAPGRARGRSPRARVPHVSRASCRIGGNGRATVGPRPRDAPTTRRTARDGGQARTQGLARACGPARRGRKRRRAALCGRPFPCVRACPGPRGPGRRSYSSSAGAPSPKPKSASGPKISASDSESTVICAATSASSRSRS